MSGPPGVSKIPTMRPSFIQKMDHKMEDELEESTSFTEEDKALLGLSHTEGRRISYGATEAAKLTKRSSLTPEKHVTGITAMAGPSIRLTAKQKEDIGLAFEALDTTGSGYMSTDHLWLVFRALGFNTRKLEMTKLLETFDRRNTGELCYHDFMSILEIKIKEGDTREEIMRSYSMFDIDQKGYIEFGDLRRVADRVNEDINDEELREMLQEADIDENGTLDSEEFYKIVKKFNMF